MVNCGADIVQLVSGFLFNALALCKCIVAPKLGHPDSVVKQKMHLDQKNLPQGFAYIGTRVRRGCGGAGAGGALGCCTSGGGAELCRCFGVELLALSGAVLSLSLHSRKTLKRSNTPNHQHGQPYRLAAFQASSKLQSI